VAYNTTSYQTVLYQKAGDYDFTIYANSSSGENNATIYYSSSASNPIEIYDCGYVRSNDTKFVLVNNLSGGQCFFVEDVNNASVDLNGYSIDGRDTFSSWYSEQILIENGIISGEYIPIYMAVVNNFIFRNMTIIADLYGFYAEEYTKTLFDNDVFIDSYPENGGIILEYYGSGNNIYFKDTTITLEELIIDASIYDARSIFYNTFENVTFLLPSGNEKFYFNVYGLPLCIFSFIDSNYSNGIFNLDDEEAELVVNEYSRLDIFSVDQNGYGIPTSLEIASLSPFEHNPTKRVLSSTESDGIGKIFLSNKLKFFKEGEDNIVYEDSFPSYNIKAYVGNVMESQNITFTSPAQVNFTFVLPVAFTYINSCIDLESSNNYKLQQNIIADQDPCISADGVSNVTLDLNGYSINGNSGNSILINNSANIEVLDGELINSSNGIFSENSSYLNFRNLEIDKSLTGILTKQVRDSTIRDNLIRENDIGVNMISSQNVILIQNTFFNNTENVIIDPSEDIIFIKNILQAAKVGLKLIELIRSVFIGNTLIDNNESIILNKSSNIDLIRTNISSVSLDLKSIDSNVSFSNVFFNTNKIQEVGESTLFGFFPPTCIFGEYVSHGTVCNGTVSLDLNIDLRVVNNSYCVIKNGVTITGDIIVEGGTLYIEDGILNGNIINGTGASVTVKGSNTVINGNVSVGNGSEDVIKDVNVTGNIETENTDIVIIKNNYVGGSVLSTNDKTLVIKENIIDGSIQITNSTSCDEKNNIVGGSNSGC